MDDTGQYVHPVGDDDGSDRDFVRVRGLRICPVEIQRKQFAVHGSHPDDPRAADDDSHSRVLEPEGLEYAQYALAVYSHVLDGEFDEGGTLYLHLPAIFQGHTEGSRGSRLYRWRRRQQDIHQNYAA